MKKGDISGNILDYFNVENHKFGRFYLLPKIHKRMYDIPGKPVISNCGFYPENISAFLDHQLKPIAMQVISYKKDTNDFLKKLRDLPDLPEESIICTTYMAVLEEDFLETLIKKSQLCRRYIHDISVICQHGEDELKIFLDELNNFHPSIKFTCEYSREKVNHLDVQVIVREGKLYVKQTDSHQYLEPSSCHPYHYTKPIPYSQALRRNWICSENFSFDLRCNEFEEGLIKRNCNPTVIMNQILKARVFSRDTLLDNVKKVRNNGRLLLALTYHPSIKNFQDVLNEAHIFLTPNK